jgi:predicted membrane-bound spermidine synthase
MTLKRKSLYTALSLFSIVILGLLIYVLSGGLSGNTDSFTLALLFTYTMLFSVGMGFGLLIMRLSGTSKAKMLMIYILFGLLNIVAGVVFYFSADITDSTLGTILFAASIVIGCCICWDVYLKK